MLNDKESIMSVSITKLITEGIDKAKQKKCIFTNIDS